MESIFFEKKGTKLILRYTPDNGVDWLFEKIVEEKQEHHIKNTFFVKECNLYRNDEQEHDTEEVIRFCIGEIGADYVALDSDILSVSNHFYFSNDIVLKPKMFVAYRNNYVPVREFAGAIQQIEKYIFCLTARKENREYVISKLKEKIPIDITPEIVNPQGILLLGRSNEFNLEQKRDFELIKRQYKNIADIMTYDDLIQRLKNIITSFKMKL